MSEMSDAPAFSDLAKLETALAQRDALVMSLLSIRQLANNPQYARYALAQIFDIATRASRLESNAVVGSPPK